MAFMGTDWTLFNRIKGKISPPPIVALLKGVTEIHTPTPMHSEGHEQQTYRFRAIALHDPPIGGERGSGDCHQVVLCYVVGVAQHHI